MAYLAHFSSFKKSIKLNNKIPEYAKDFRKEWLYIQGINKKCGDFSKMLDETTSFEKVFWSSLAKALIKHFKNVLEAQKKGKLQNISKLKFKLSAVDKIVQLRVDLYYFMGNIFYADFFTDDEFQDFFENFIIFTNNVNIKYEENFEDDLYDINDYIRDHVEIDSISDIDNISENENENENENESESDSDYEDHDSDSDENYDSDYSNDGYFKTLSILLDSVSDL